MKAYELGYEMQARFGFTHRFEITYADLVAPGAVTSGAVSLMDYVAGQGIIAGAVRLVTNFDGGSTSALSLKVGWDGGTTDDDDGALEALEIHEDATEVKFSDFTGVAFATKRTGYYPLDAGTYKATFAATGANFNTLTQGEVHIFATIINLAKAS